MERIVIDTSALIAAILDEPEKARLVELTEGASLLAPYSLHWEIGNAFSAMFKKGSISPKNAQAALRIYETIPIQFLEVDLGRSLEIAYRRRIYAYDAYMIASTLTHKVPLLTLDNTLKRHAKACGTSLLEI